MKKVSMSLITLAMAFVIPFSTADAAGNGGWDVLDFHRLTYNSGYGFYDTANERSTGGDFKIVARVDNGSFKATLWESDPGTGNDDYVGYTYFSGDGWDSAVFRDINRFVDGSNNRAEFYVQSYDSDARNIWIGFYD